MREAEVTACLQKVGPKAIPLVCDYPPGQDTVSRVLGACKPTASTENPASFMLKKLNSGEAYRVSHVLTWSSHRYLWSISLCEAFWALQQAARDGENRVSLISGD